jgi:hypothetical protein
MEGESCVLALPHGNITFRLTSVKPFHVGDIKAGSEGPEDNPEYYGEGDGEGDAGIIPSTIPPIPLKRGRGRPRKNPNMTVFL